MEPKISPGRGVSTTPIMRFGAFELDLRAAELRKHGRKIRLQEQHFQILVELLKRPVIRRTHGYARDALR